MFTMFLVSFLAGLDAELPIFFLVLVVAALDLEKSAHLAARTMGSGESILLRYPLELVYYGTNANAVKLYIAVLVLYSRLFFSFLSLIHI